METSAIIIGRTWIESFRYFYTASASTPRCKAPGGNYRGVIMENIKIDKVAFEGPVCPDRGYTIRAFYLKENIQDCLIEIFKEEQLVREFLFPAYKIWNLQAHFKDIVDGEIEKSMNGYEMAAWNGIEGYNVRIIADPKNA